MVRPCSKCMRIAVRKCAECCIRADPISVHSVQRSNGSLNVVLERKDGEAVTLCEACVANCARSFDQLGERQWG